MIQIEPIGQAPRPLYPSSIILQDALPIGQTRRRGYRPRVPITRVTRRRAAYLPGVGPAMVTRRGAQTMIIPLRQQRVQRGAIAAQRRAQAQIRRQYEIKRRQRHRLWRQERAMRQAPSPAEVERQRQTRIRRAEQERTWMQRQRAKYLRKTGRRR